MTKENLFSPHNLNRMGAWNKELVWQNRRVGKIDTIVGSIYAPQIGSHALIDYLLMLARFSRIEQRCEVGIQNIVFPEKYRML